MRKLKSKHIVTAGAIIAATLSFALVPVQAQETSVLNCRDISEGDSKLADYLSKFRTTYLQERSLIEMSNLVNFYDVRVSDCTALIAVTLTPNALADTGKETWLFQKDPWKFIGINK